MSFINSFQTQEVQIRGGIDVLAPQYENTWTRPLDLVNIVARPDGYIGGPGWAVVANEIASANGVICHVTGFPRSDEGNDTVATTIKRAYKNVAGTWTSIQDATDFTLVSNDHPTTTWYADKLYWALPRSGAANAQRVWTGTGNLAALGGSPLNARSNEIFGNRLVYGPVWNTTPTYQPYDVYRSADGDPTTHSSEYTRFSQSSSFLMRILRLGQMLICYKQHGIGVLQISGGENADIEPYEPDEIPTNVGLAIPEALVAGGDYHFFLGNEDIYLIRGFERPEPIGGPVATLIFGALAAGSFVLAGYDRRSPENEGFFLLTNLAVAAGNKAIGPNAVATTYTYFHFDLLTKTWSRGELTNIPRAVGNYYSRFGFLTAAPISQTAMIMALDSTAGSSVYELNYATTTRVSAAFTPRLLTTLMTAGEPFHWKQVAECWPLLKRRSSGNCTIRWYTAANPQAVPTLRQTTTFAMDGTSGNRTLTGVVGKVVQAEVSFDTNDFYFQGIGMRAKVRQ